MQTNLAWRSSRPSIPHQDFRNFQLTLLRKRLVATIRFRALTGSVTEVNRAVQTSSGWRKLLAVRWNTHILRNSLEDRSTMPLCVIDVFVRIFYPHLSWKANNVNERLYNANVSTFPNGLLPTLWSIPTGKPINRMNSLRQFQSLSSNYILNRSNLHRFPGG